MNRLVAFVALLLAGVGFAASALGAPPVATALTARKASDPVAELQSQDSAFSLLIECYRQLQLSLIEIDYEHRLEEAGKIADSDHRMRAREEASRHAEERLQKLGATLEEMVAAYHSSRAAAERDAGVQVPAQVDRYKAARQLSSYVAFTPPEQGGHRIEVPIATPGTVPPTGH